VSPPPVISPMRKLKSWLKGKGWTTGRALRRSHLDGIAFDHLTLDRYRPVVDNDVPEYPSGESRRDT
jgi:hypothetical protein